MSFWEHSSTNKIVRFVEHTIEHALTCDLRPICKLFSTSTSNYNNLSSKSLRNLLWACALTHPIHKNKINSSWIISQCSEKWAKNWLVKHFFGKNPKIEQIFNITFLICEFYVNLWIDSQRITNIVDLMRF